MPMVKWRVDPTAVLRIGSDDVSSRNGPDVDVNDVTNFIVVNVARQLSCLCKQSTEMFDELELMAAGIVRRAIRLTDRVNSLKNLTSKLNSTVEEVCLDDIGAYKPFRSDASKQPSFSHQRPQCVVEVYLGGMSVPALAKMNQFRDDDEDCVRMYTNPDFFFEIWSSQIKKEMSEKPKRKKRKAQMQAAVTVRTPKNVKQLALIDKVQRQEEGPAVVKPKPAMSDVVDAKPIVDRFGRTTQAPPPDIKRKPSITAIVPGDAPRVPPPTPKGKMQPTLPKPTSRPNVAPPPPPPPPPPHPAPPPPVDTDTSGTIQHNDLPPSPPPTPPPPPPHTPPTDSIPEGLDAIPSPPLPSPPILRNTGKNAKRGTLYSVSNFDRRTAFFPSPPPPMISDTVDSDSGNYSSLSPLPPPPPPPPPLPSDPLPPPPESAFQIRSATPSKTPKRESRSDLLSAIRTGITFRKVEETRTADKSKQPKGGLFDVQTILEMRRKALEEDSEEEDDDDVTDGDEWGE